MKQYLRIDFSEDDGLLGILISSAEELCASVCRISTEEYLALSDDNAKTAVLYAVAYRRVKWNNRGCKSTVWRCVSRVLKGKMDFDCPARTVKEEVLQGAIVTAVNDAYARRNAVISLLKTNIQETVFDDLEARIAAIDAQLAELQQQMVDNSGNHELVEELGLQIDDLRGDRQDILAEAAERTDLQTRMNDMIAFLEEMPAAVTEYSEALARRLVERITIFDEKIVVELKSGLQMEVEE